jgi:tetratricopeptide (TPR) repeat protein
LIGLSISTEEIDLFSCYSLKMVPIKNNLKRMNLKHLNLVIPLSSVIISGLSLVPFMQTAQGEPTCYMTDPSGQIIDLGNLCESNQQQELRGTMNAQELFEQGRALGKQGLYEEAAARYTQAVAIDPNFAEAYAFRGNLRGLQENAQGAIEDLQKALEIFKARGDLTMANSMQQLIEVTREEFGLSQ